MLTAVAGKRHTAAPSILRQERADRGRGNNCPAETNIF